jgi:hypothetical protein
MTKREDNEQPSAIIKNNWRFHHLGIPTKEVKPDEFFLKGFGVHVSGFETSEFGIQWMRYEENSTIDPLIQKVPHLCFEVDNLEEAIIGREILTPINSPSEGCRVAMIIENGAPIELIEFTK